VSTGDARSVKIDRARETGTVRRAGWS